ncbi:UNVERIFIED_CONTAM: hypothetical protein Sindi_0961800 [Sesamum indicum]
MEEGLSTVASGMGKPLYQDAIMRACTRLDFARICVMLDISSKLPKHIIIMTPNEDGGEAPYKVDVEYEWLPPKSTSWNVPRLSDQVMDKSQSASTNVQFENREKPATVMGLSREEKAWDDNCLDIDVLALGPQFIHARVNNRTAHELLIITVIYGANEAAKRRELWESLESFAPLLANIPWMVGGDFNAVRDLSVVCGMSGDIRMAMEEYNSCIQNVGLLLLPMQGEWFTCHNYSASPCNLWKRLDRILTNDTWTRYPTLFYTCLASQTSNRLPMVISGDTQRHFRGMFRFDNYLTLSPTFIPSVQNIRQHEVVGIPMYAITRKLKDLKPVFREQRKNKGNLSHNVQLAKGFIEMAQQLVSLSRHDEGGDQSTRIFFRKIAQRRAARKILQINDPHGTTLTKLDAVAHEFIKFFQSLLGGNRRQKVIDLQHLRPWGWHLLDKEEALHLTRSFTIEDVKIAIFDIAAWLVVGTEVTRAILDFFATGRLLKQINNTILALNPKWWDLLLATLKLYGFLETFIRWIEECITTAFFSVGFNRKPHGFFQGARGLGYGDPLSPYLFVLVMELGIADDVILFCRTNIDSIHIFKKGLNQFGDWSRLCLNSQKSHHILSQVAKIDARIAGWEGLSISYAGRFLWKGTGDSGYAKVTWKEVCKPLSEGGQGLKEAQGWRKLIRLRTWLQSEVKYRIGDVRDFYFRRDPWHPLGPLIKRFPWEPSATGLQEHILLHVSYARDSSTGHLSQTWNV